LQFIKLKNEEFMNKLNHKSYILNQLLRELFFAFLVIFLIILIYGLFQPDPGLAFFVPYWKKLAFLLGTTVFFGILAVFWRRE